MRNLLILSAFVGVGFIPTTHASVLGSDELKLVFQGTAITGVTPPTNTTVYDGLLNEQANGLDINSISTPTTVTIGASTTVSPTDFLLFSYSQATGTQTNFNYAVGLTGVEGLSDVAVHARYNDTSNHTTYEYWGLISDSDSSKLYAANAGGVNSFLNDFFTTHAAMKPGTSFPAPTIAMVAETGGLQDITSLLFSDYGQSLTIPHTQVLVSSDISPVPVPAAVWLFGSGLAGLTGFARKRKAA